MEDVKNIFKSKTFWIGAIAVIIGILEAISSELTNGGELTILGVLMIVLRVFTKTGIKI